MPNKVFLEVNGSLYEGFENINYSKSMENLSGSFSFTASTEKKEFVPFKGQEICQIIINNKPLITGFIESINYLYDEGSHIITINGRDRTCDVIDNSIIGNIDFKAPIQLETIIKNVLKSANLNIQVINKAGDLLPFEETELKAITGGGGEDGLGLEQFGFSENELAAGEVGENMFDFLEKYCRKRSVLITSNGNANIIITRAAQDMLSGILLNELNNNNNNIKRASINYDFSNRFNKYICKSQGNPSSSALLESADGEGLADIESTKGEAIDDEIRESRVLEFLNETSSTAASNIDRAKWEANIRRARSLVYTCELNHLFADREETNLYEENKLITVKDDFCDINSIMLIRSVTYNLSTTLGTSVVLELVPRDAYTPQPSANKTDSKYNKIGENAK